MIFKRHVICASTASCILTLAGLYNVLKYKTPPTHVVVCWFPFLGIVGLPTDWCVLLALIQYPLFAIMYIVAVRRWPAINALAVTGIFYGLLVWLGFYCEKARSMGN